MTRIFQSIILQENSQVQLDEEATHHVARVLRGKVGDVLTLFNGEGGEFECAITRIDKKNVTVDVKKFSSHEAESSLELYLAQGISRGEKMDHTIQKAVELGVKKIIPLFTERCNVKLDEDRKEKRFQHWRSIVIGACEQCGRNRVPEIFEPKNFSAWCKSVEADWKFVLAPSAEKKLSEYSIQKNARVVLLIGPEGGLSEKEIAEAFSKGFLPLSLGPRILRTETAGVAAVTALQSMAGDMG
jgi:16S rRNA (uracil1498-N3)-methyltransferase